MRGTIAKRRADARAGADLMVVGGAGVRWRELGREGCALVRQSCHTCVELMML